MPRNHHRQPFTAAAFTLSCLLAFLLYFPLGCAVSATGPAASTAQKEAAAQSTGVLPSRFFGLVVKDPSMQAAVASGARRLWNSGVTWAALEPSQGQFNWSTLDAEVEAAGQSGAEITLTLGMTPTWASSQPATASTYGAGATAMPANLGDWDTYVAAVAARYRGRIAAYNVWNAPEDPLCWTGPGSQLGSDMATLAAHAADSIHSVDPAAAVVSPALSPAGLRLFLSAGGGAHVDAIGSSLIAAGQAPESMTATVEALRSAMAGTAADGKPVWNEQGSWVLPQGGLPGDVQAAYVARALLLNAGYAIARFHWYAWDDTAAGTLALSAASAQPTLAGVAYGVVEGWLAGAQINGCAATAEGVWSCEIVRNGTAGWVLWSANGATAHSSALGASTVTDLSGNTVAVNPDGTVEVGASPVLLM